MDLKEGKQRVEAYLAADPLAQASFAKMQARSGSIALRWSIVVACLGAAAAEATLFLVYRIARRHENAAPSLRP